MASLLFPDDERSVQPLLIPPPPDERGPLAPDPRADAFSQATGQVYQRVSDYIAKQQRDAIDRGLWEGGQVWEGGHPTRGGLLDAARQTAEGVAMGTTSSGGAPKPEFPIMYHGSPHKFPPTPRNPLGEFDPAKIGTGEGAQAYGVGAGYLAENEAVAREIRNNIGIYPQLEKLQFNADKSPNRPAQVASKLHEGYSPEEITSQLKVLDPAATDVQIGQWISQGRGVLDDVTKAHGHMYEVRVNADPERFLHWDTPISRQSDELRGALKQNLGLAPEAALPASIADMTGEQFYRALEKKVGREQASSILHEKYGIPGIRYLDAGSRGAGEGSHNAVVFSPETMEIIRRYGLAGLMLGGGGLLSPNQQEQ